MVSFVRGACLVFSVFFDLSVTDAFIGTKKTKLFLGSRRGQAGAKRDGKTKTRNLR